MKRRECVYRSPQGIKVIEMVDKGEIRDRGDYRVENGCQRTKGSKTKRYIEVKI